MKTKNDNGGFTLVELLVVIVVLVALIAVVFPSFAGSRDRGQEARCLGNLRQLTAAWIAYTSDNRGKLVPNGDESTEPASLTDPTALPGGSHAQWCPGRQDFTSQLSPVTSTSSNNLGFLWIQLGLIYPYVGNVNAYHCPADTTSISSFGARYPYVRSVSMNGWLSPFAPYNGNVQVESYYKDSDLVRPGPSKLFVFADENSRSINDSSLFFDPTVAQWITSPASYHNSGGGLSFADGHALIKRWTDPTVLTWSQNISISQGNPSFIRLSPTQNPVVDLNFLQAASTYIK